MLHLLRMFKGCNALPLLCFWVICVPFAAGAQTDTLSSAAETPSRLRISLLTVGTGDEIYASFGHTGIRITDSVRGTDIVYNWGTFDGFQEDFEIKFMRGKLLYYASSETFQSFYSMYVREQRGVEEQVLLLNDAQKRRLSAFVLENQKEENRYYKYDFLYDNCATRLRDIFPGTFGPAFRWGPSLPPDSKLTFRDQINIYLKQLPWERFGINLLLGSGIDQVMSHEDAMFLPDYLRNGLAGATLYGRPIAAKAERILPPAPPLPAPGNGPFLLTLIFAALVILGSILPGFNIIGHVAGNALVFISGLLGCLIVFMWLGTDHQSCRNNFNVLWALPTHVIVPFVRREKLTRYALVSISLILACLLLHVFRIQSFPLWELWPVWLALLVRFGMIYRSAHRPFSDEPEAHHHH